MKFTKTLILISLLSIGIVISTNEATDTTAQVGAKVAVSEATILTAQKKYLPPILEGLSNKKYEDYKTVLPGTIVDTYVEITKIKVNLGGLKSDNIGINLVDPNVITVKGTDISASGSFDVATKTAGIPVWSTVNIDITRLNVSFKVRLTTKPCKEDNKKRVINAEAFDSTLDFDFSIKLGSSILDWIKSWFDEKIKKSVKEIIADQMKKTVLPLINKILNEYTETLPIKTELLPGKIYMDYSLIAEPVIANKLIIINIDGRILNVSAKSDDFPIGSSLLPAISEAPKGLKILISGYTINSALNSYYNVGALAYNMELPGLLDMVADNKTFLLKYVSPTNLLKNSLRTQFGDKFVTTVSIKVTEAPIVEFTQKTLNANVLKLHLELSAKKIKTDKTFETNLTPFVSLDLTVSAKLRGKINEGGQLDGSLEEVKISNFHIVKNIVEFPGDDYMAKTIINYFIDGIIKGLNEKQLKAIKLSPPAVAGIAFDDTTVNFNDDHVAYNFGLKFAPSTRRRNLLKKVKK